MWKNACTHWALLSLQVAEAGWVGSWIPRKICISLSWQLSDQVHDIKLFSVHTFAADSVYEKCFPWWHCDFSQLNWRNLNRDLSDFHHSTYKMKIMKNQIFVATLFKSYNYVVHVGYKTANSKKWRCIMERGQNMDQKYGDCLSIKVG